MTDWTEGPWYANGDGAVISENDIWVKPLPIDSWEGNRVWPSQDQEEANAHLIAAAPELYEALAMVEPIIDEMFETLEPGRKISKALAKARGER